ncbi:DUF29 domain-containing protein [Oculatella sp. FACHB-28]|uniref:DUF29 domain-containing protein n=1 Tax=Cyanophyceae TaxID=3028117 RepID=UPI0016860BF4|nr:MULTISPECIES: DUF29 domain-containing protein [Cyanophyceae]MBD1868690.1 DUF29 domain-containing protein [Cyanobacteria bacterium FACHB-471]MBD2057323.1 DUF29 domain-containing protein [Oculatella sp. FACHB-28]MBD2067856.1 DUF29 domain-containing protein [Leptolyngbya sp. FACHB-671]
MKNLYESDFYAWTKEQAELLKNKTWEQIDLPNLIEEIESLGRQERQELRNRLGVLLGHLLKWQYQPSNRGNSWLSTIREQRREASLVLRENPSLKPYLSEAVCLGYESGVDLAVRETGMDYDVFPAECPYTEEQILEETFLPD